MNFYNKLGQMATGSRLRMLTDLLTEDATQVYRLYGLDFKAKWFPVFYLLSDGKARTITGIAGEIGHSHPSVSNIVREMLAKGLVNQNKDTTDARRNMVALSDVGKTYIEPLKATLQDVENAVKGIAKQSAHDLWKAIDEWETMLGNKSLLKRVSDERRKREQANIRIVDYCASYKKAFRQLNEEWITTYFEMEDTDYKVLDNPDEYIIRHGGHIMVALYNDEPVGVCALLKMDDAEHDFEFAKMAVTPHLRGLNIGYLLGQAVVEKAKALGASRIYLESNTALVPAIALYQKLGFKEISGHSSPYKRSNIKMELTIDSKK